jgi:hypothetical protein
VLPGNGVLLNSAAKGQRAVNLTATGNVTLQGDVLVTGPNVVNVTLLNNSVLTGAMPLVGNRSVSNVIIETASQWNMTGSSTIAQDVAIKAGSLIFASARAFAATGKALVLSVGRNYSMDSSSTLSLGVGGTKGKQYDHLEAGSANLNGTLAVSSLGNFRPVAGSEFEVVHTVNNKGRNGQFAQVNDSLNNNPNLEPLDIYAPNGVALLYVAAPPGPAPTPPPTPPPPPGPPPPPEPTPTPRHRGLRVAQLLRPRRRQDLRLAQLPRRHQDLRPRRHRGLRLAQLRNQDRRLSTLSRIRFRLWARRAIYRSLSCLRNWIRLLNS